MLITRHSIQLLGYICCGGHSLQRTTHLAIGNVDAPVPVFGGHAALAAIGVRRGEGGARVGARMVTGILAFDGDLDGGQLRAPLLQGGDWDPRSLLVAPMVDNSKLPFCML